MHIVRTMTQQLRQQRGITGLETAIIMIAFVVVASVFSYTVLTAGIFSSEKSKSAIHAALRTVESTMEIVGPVVGKDTDGDDDIDEIVFIVKNSLGGEGINWTATADADDDGLLSDENVLTHTTVITYIDTVQEVTDLAWTKIAIGKNDNLLEENEKFEITVNVSHLATKITADHTFTLEIRQRDGAGLVIQRTTAAVIDKVNDLR